MRSPVRARKVHNSARRGVSVLFAVNAWTASAPGPETRTTATAPTPGAVARAAIVSSRSGITSVVSDDGSSFQFI